MPLTAELIVNVIPSERNLPVPIVPAEVVDFASFREWGRSEAFPPTGRWSFYQDQLWVDLSMEQVCSHNGVKQALNRVLDLPPFTAQGRFFCDGVRFSHPQVDVSAEPDATFIYFDTFQAQRVQLLPSARGIGAVELEGTPDLVVEVVSDSSVTKDTVDLFALYAQAGIAEYWLIDARREPLQFEVYTLTKSQYAPVPRSADGWVRSAILQHEFRLLLERDRLGYARYELTFRVAGQLA